MSGIGNVKIYAEAETEIKNRKLKNAELTEQRRNDFAQRCPEYKELRGKLADTGNKLYDIFFNKNINTKEEIKKLEKENLKISFQIEELLLRHGLESDYLDDIYTCKKCRDCGVYENRRCDCFKDIVKRLASMELNKNSQIKLSDFNMFELDFYPDETDKGNGLNIKKVMSRNLDFCKSYAENFHLPCDGILMQGKTGLGKTHLSLAIADEVLSKGYSVVYGSVPNLFRKMEREHFGRDGEEPTELLQSADLLILDDLGTEFNTPFYVSAFYNLLNTRLNAGLPTIINTNLELSELRQRYGDHIMSRLLTMEHLVFLGSDIRVGKKFGMKK